MLSSPRVSIVVPLFGRIDLVEHQLAALRRDPELCQAELLYVLDSPELGDELRRKARELYDLYRLPARFAVMQSTGGFAAACNVGAALARASRLLFLHSDVLPSRSGWLSAMSGFLETAGTRAGAVGATLLYHDDSVQHAGLRVSAEGAVEVPFKGLHRQLASSVSAGGAGEAPRGADAVSAACLMIDREAFLAAGGFAGVYAGGTYEDVDLCGRLAALDRGNWLLPHVQLYHLEGQSRPKRTRELALPYDDWLLARRWREFCGDKVTR
jgi:GT2 family glycosyltransferase